MYLQTMNRLVRTPQAFIRSLQISRTPLHVFVEGNVDSYFYGQVCKQVIPGLFTYHIIRSDQLARSGSGKSHLLKLFESMRRRGLLVLDFKGSKSATLFFVDKDIDNLRRRMRRSQHLVYTEYYEVENYVFKHGKLIPAVSAACLRDMSDVERSIPKAEEWSTRAAILWADWLKLCLASCLLDATGVCNYSAPSFINNSPSMPTDHALFSAAFHRLEAASSYSAKVFRSRFSHLANRVDKLYFMGQQDSLFKGKWYKLILADELRTSGIAAGGALRALSDRLTSHLLQSLDFSEDWARYHREAVKSVIKLIE